MKIKYMEYALELAKKGEGKVSPNPMVGAVIVKNDTIISSGYHECFGGPHAEINAIRNVKESLLGCDIYVTLEPCCHFGKTPPCTQAIINSGIKRVFIAMLDPNPIVSGKGVKILQENGIEVFHGIMEKEAQILNERFIKYITTKKPFVLMKWAMTLDGKICTSTGDSKWISCDESRKYVHKLRNSYMSIMVGIGTVLSDNPILNVRLEDGDYRNPDVIVVDSNLRIPLNANVLKEDYKRRVFVVCTQDASREKKKLLINMGATIIETPSNDGRVNIKSMIESIGKQGIDGILLEGGSTLNYSMLSKDEVDKVMLFIAPKIVGGQNAKTPVGGDGIQSMNECITLDNMKYRNIDTDIIIEGYIKKLC